MRLSDEALRAVTVGCLGYALARGISLQQLVEEACEREDEIKADEFRPSQLRETA